MNNNIKNLVIVGGGTAGWMTAAKLAHHFAGTELSITLVESSSVGTVGVGEATIPSIREFYLSLGIKNVDIMRATNATCKLGIKFQDWHSVGESFFHPFGLHGQAAKGVAFHHYWRKLHNFGEVPDIESYSLPIAMAKTGRFALPPQKPSSQLSVYDWALHFDANLFAKFLRQFSEEKGVSRLDRNISQVKVREQDGFIDHLVFDNGEKLAGDFFIDCSGFKGLLIEDALKTGFIDWSDYLPMDSAIVSASEALETPPPYTKATALKAGWQWQIPLQNRTGNGFVYCSDFISDDDASKTLLENIQGKVFGSAQKLNFTTGRRKKSWHKNCVAIGLSAGFIEPLESTSIAVIVTALDNLTKLFPTKSFDQACIDHYNQRAITEFELIRDFIILHYKATARTDSPLWNYCKNMEIPDTLAERLELFRSRGVVLNQHWQTFHEPSWIAILNGYKIYADNYDPVVDSIDINVLRQSFKNMQQDIQDLSSSTISHQAFIERYCGVK